MDQIVQKLVLKVLTFSMYYFQKEGNCSQSG